MATSGSLLQPCRRASSIACALRSAARAADRKLAASAQCTRPLISRKGRPIRWAKATPR